MSLKYMCSFYSSIVLFHEFALTYNMVEQKVGMFCVLSGGKTREEPEPPPSQEWDEFRLRVRSWGGGGLLENHQRTEVNWLYIYT